MKIKVLIIFYLLITIFSINPDLFLMCLSTHKDRKNYTQTITKIFANIDNYTNLISVINSDFYKIKEALRYCLKNDNKIKK